MQKVAEIAKAASPGVVVVCDNTFATPYGQRPLEMGVDVVMHSVTKYINGHSDVIMGLLVTNSEELNRRLRFIQNSMGAVPSPFDWYACVCLNQHFSCPYPSLYEPHAVLTSLIQLHFNPFLLEPFNSSTFRIAGG